VGGCSRSLGRDSWWVGAGSVLVLWGWGQVLEAAAEDLLSGVARVAQRLWTSDARYGGEGVAAADRRELCSLLNAALRADDPELLAAAMPLIRAINALCVVRGARDEARLRFPPAGCCLRGGGLPDAHRSFFVPGRKYRIPGFLATSFDREAAASPPYPSPPAPLVGIAPCPSLTGACPMLTGAIAPCPSQPPRIAQGAIRTHPPRSLQRRGRV
jgi:hypothetical protein